MRGNSDPAGFLSIGFVAALWTFFKGFRVMREYKVLEDTPRIPIRSVPMGFVHIRGKAESAEVLSSPVSHTPCCFYKIEIDEWKSKHDGHEWVRYCVDMNGYRFHLADGTGKILIDAHAAEYDLPATTTREVHSQARGSSGLAAGDADLLKYVTHAKLHSLADRVGQFIGQRLANAPGTTDDPQLQARHDALRQFAAVLPNGAQGPRAAIEAIERLAQASGTLSDPEKEQHRQLMLEGLPMAEAASASGALDRLMPGEQPATGRFRLRESVVIPGQEYLISGTCIENSTEDQDRCRIAKGRNEPTFVISNKNEVQLHTELKKRALLMIFGGAAVAIACAVGLLIRFKML
jgi:hypothetical protein